MTSMLVPSLSKLGTSYTVTRLGDRMTCDCPAFSIHGKGLRCKHTEIVRMADNIRAKCHEAHGLADAEGRLCAQCLVAVLVTMARKVKSSYVTKDDMKARVEKVRAKKKKATV